MKQLDFTDQVEAAPEPAPKPAATTPRKRSTTHAPGRPKARQPVRPPRKNRPAGSREDMQRLNMEVSRTLHKRLKLKAIYEDRTVTDIVLQAINDYLNAH